MNETSQASPFDLLGGNQAIERVVNRFYDLMEQDPAYAALRAMHAPDLAPMRRSLAGFLTGWSGGPRDWFEANPGKCMVSLHGAFPITQATAQQWAQAMGRAIADADMADQAMAETLRATLERIALAMAPAD